MTKKVAILGSCVSEGWFHHQRINERLDAELVPRYQPSTIVSMAARPVNIVIDPGQALNSQDELALKMDFDKSFLDVVVSVQPDILIVELLRDSRNGAMSFGGTWITPNHILKRSPMALQTVGATTLSPVTEPDAYFELFAQSARTLSAFFRERIPRCRIVLNKVRWAEYFIDEEGNLQSYRPWDQNSYFISNLRLDPLEKIFAKEVVCDSIKIDDVPIFADIQHIWGPAPDHFVRYFDSAFGEKLRALISE
jgi:hypothetical protein